MYEHEITYLDHYDYFTLQEFGNCLLCRSPNSHYDEMEMGPQSLPKSYSKFTTEPQYEESGGGVTSGDVAMQGNPAYQSVDLVASTKF